MKIDDITDDMIVACIGKPNDVITTRGAVTPTPIGTKIARKCGVRRITPYATSRLETKCLDLAKKGRLKCELDSRGVSLVSVRRRN